MIDTTLVYSYRHIPFPETLVSLQLSEEEYLKIILNWFKASIYSARKLGYKTAVYCDYSNTEFFETLTDEVHTFKSYYDCFWDSYKFLPLEHREDNFIVVDQDVIFKDAIPNFTEDVLVDNIDHSRHLLYTKGEPYLKNSANILKQFDNLGIKELIPEWTSEHIPVVCTGVLKFNNKTLQQKYLDYWKIIHKLVIDNNLEPKISTSVAAEFLLSCLIYNGRYSCKSLSKNYFNPWYKHYNGKQKFRKNIVSYELEKNSSSLI